MSGTHVTVIVVAICVAVIAAPIGAIAATGTLVNITDPSDKGKKARISAKSSLYTSLRDPVTGANAKINPAGHQLVSVTNPARKVSTVPLAPTSPVTNALGNCMTVPAGKRLVVETLSVSVTGSAGAAITAFLRYTSGGTQAYLFLPLSRSGATSGYDDFVATLPVKLYADPGTQIYVEAGALTGTLGGTRFCTVSGYLVNA